MSGCKTGSHARLVLSAATVAELAAQAWQHAALRRYFGGHQSVGKVVLPYRTGVLYRRLSYPWRVNNPIAGGKRRDTKKIHIYV